MSLSSIRIASRVAPRMGSRAKKRGLGSFLHTSGVACSRPAPYDTARFVAQLEQAGVAPAQASALASALRDTIHQSFETIERDLVSHNEAEKWRFARKNDFAQLKSEMQLLEHNDFALMKTTHERLMNDIERVRAKLREEITRTQAGVRLDLNLEKGASAFHTYIAALHLHVPFEIHFDVRERDSLYITSVHHICLSAMSGIAAGAQKPTNSAFSPISSACLHLQVAFATSPRYMH